jgi:hypothetical protein
MQAINCTNTIKYGFKHGYYTIGNHYIKYDLNYPIGEALKMLESNIGPNNCPDCINDGMICGVFVSCCKQCNLFLYGKFKNCSCLHTVKENIENGYINCNDQYCETGIYRKYGNTKKIGVRNNFNEFVTYNIYGNNTTSMHIHFED